MRNWLFTFLVFAMAACTDPVGDAAPVADIRLDMDGIAPSEAAFLIVRIEDGQRWSSGGLRLSQRFSPASTSKIPHTLIALETGAVSGPDEMFIWDGQVRFSDGWNKDQTFATAFKRSTVWIYQIVTPRIGHEALKNWLTKFGYGNADIGDPEKISEYWLTCPLAISAEEQVAFLNKLQARRLPLSAETYAQALPMMLSKSSDRMRLYAKTGWKLGDERPDIGWYVGWAEQISGPSQGTYVFAFNLDMNTPEIDRHRRKDIVHTALAELGVMIP